MPWIENVACTDIPSANHHDAGLFGILIQIMDPGSFFPEPKFPFKEVHKFEFLDQEDDDLTKNPDLEEALISQDQAKQIVDILKKALKENRSVVVHCFAGLCRSGAVAEIGTTMGFDDVGNFRSPNTRVMRMMMSELGLPYEVKNHNWREDYRQYMSMKFD
jgi:predicted protein tyrosine phosphatase